MSIMWGALRPTEYYLVSSAGVSGGGGATVSGGVTYGYLVLQHRSGPKFKLSYSGVGIGVGLSWIPIDLSISTTHMKSKALGEVCLMPAFSGSDLAPQMLKGRCLIFTYGGGMGKGGSLTVVFFGVPGGVPNAFIFADAVGVLCGETIEGNANVSATVYTAQVYSVDPM